MTWKLETAANPEVQRHLDRNPGVIAYREINGGTEFEVDYNPQTPVPAIIAAEAKSLNLPELAGDTTNDPDA